MRAVDVVRDTVFRNGGLQPVTITDRQQGFWFVERNGRMRRREMDEIPRYVQLFREEEFNPAGGSLEIVTFERFEWRIPEHGKPNRWQRCWLYKEVR